tara:strand:- start:4920 stop:5261 length:342 start_codon:yes stop_codon:yes gene_type:complete
MSDELVTLAAYLLIINIGCAKKDQEPAQHRGQVLGLFIALDRRNKRYQFMNQIIALFRRKRRVAVKGRLHSAELRMLIGVRKPENTFFVVLNACAQTTRVQIESHSDPLILSA